MPDGTKTSMTAWAEPQVSGPAQLSTVSSSVPPFTLIERFETSAHDADFSTSLQVAPSTYL